MPKFEKTYPRNLIRYGKGVWWYYRVASPIGTPYLINYKDTLPEAWRAANDSAYATIEAMRAPGPKESIA